MDFPIVAIAASAGGLEAVSELLATLPAKNGLAYVVVQHLDPDRESLLAALLSKKTAMPVEQIQDGMIIAVDHVYIIPPNATVTLSGDALQLTPRGNDAPHHPADALFVSVAEGRADSAIGIVLSGGDADGSLGVRAIKHHGGITFAQEPATARFPSMPRNAIETDCVDFVLRPSAIGRELMRLAAHPYLRALPQMQTAEALEEDTLRRVFRRLRTAHAVDFTHYKRSTLQRRLARRMALRKVDELTDYVRLLEDDPVESAALFQDFLIRVTGFFRDPEAFETLAGRVFPSLCEARSAKERIRIWVPGCASGEEVYSIAMALVEYLGDRLAPAGIQIFGTDVSEAAIEKARAGAYVESISQEVSAERLNRFFIKEEDSRYRIAKSIRDLCIFARQDVTRDPPFSRLDLVSCRNVLIYLDAAAQRRVMRVFHYSLRPQGFLMLGPSESVGTASDLFDLIDKHERIYTRRSAAPRTALVFGDPPGDAPYGGTREVSNNQAAIGETSSAQREADRLLLARYAPASLLVDDALNVLQVRGGTGRFVELGSGSPSFNLHRMVRPELLVELSPALQEARATRAEVHRDGLRVGDLGDVTLQVVPVQATSEEPCYLILLEAGSRPSGLHGQQRPEQAVPESEKDRRLAQLQREMTSTREYLQSMLEKHEAVKEELKSAHEEVLSANEEFQSTNEELETAKEELQSANEELTTTNDELRDRNRELSVLNASVQKSRETSERARAYADAIVASVREPLLVLDSDLTVLRANVAFYASFQSRQEEIEGHSLVQVGLALGRLNIVDLLGQLHGVLTRNAVIDDYEIEYAEPGKLPQALSVSARKIPGDGTRAELILLALEDITERRHAEDAVRYAGERFRFMAEVMPQKILTATGMGNIDYFNPQWTEYTGLSFDQIKDWGWTQFIHPEDLAENTRLWKHSIATGEPFDFEHRFRRADGEYRWHLSGARAYRDAAGQIQSWFGSSTDIHDVKEADKRKDEFLAMLAHELRNPLAPIRHATLMLRRGTASVSPANLYDLIERQTSRLVRLVDELLDVARISRGHIELKTEVVDLADIVRHAADAGRSRIADRKHELTLVLPQAPIYVTGDAVRLEQIVSNLLENAAKYTEPGGQIRIELAQEHEQARLSVRDNGVGLAAETLESIFGLFTQVDRSLAHSGGGLGIGLTLVRRVLALHGGSVEARSEGLGHGTEFVVRLPVASEQPSAGNSGSHREEGPAAPKTQPRRVLIVEDNADAAESMALLVRSWGHEVAIARDGPSALELARGFQPERALVDIGLPGMTGYELGRRLREQMNHRGLCLIAMTGYGRDEDRRTALDAGFDVHLVKPANPEELQHLLANGGSKQSNTGQF